MEPPGPCGGPSGLVSGRGNEPCDPEDPPGWEPIPLEDEPQNDFPNNPCKVVDSLMTTNNFPQYYSTLRSNVAQNNEKGFMFTNPFSASTTYEEVNGPPGTLRLPMIPVVPIDGAVHSHYNDPLRLSVYSFDDMFYLYNWFKNGKISNLKTFTFGMVSDSTAYIMMITDSTAFVNFGNKFLADKELEYMFNRAFYVGMGIAETNPIAENEWRFLHALQSFSTGLSLFKGNNTLTNFNRIKLNDSMTVVSYPCD